MSAWQVEGGEAGSATYSQYVPVGRLKFARVGELPPPVPVLFALVGDVNVYELSSTFVIVRVWLLSATLFSVPLVFVNVTLAPVASPWFGCATLTVKLLFVVVKGLLPRRTATLCVADRSVVADAAWKPLTLAAV